MTSDELATKRISALDLTACSLQPSCIVTEMGFLARLTGTLGHPDFSEISRHPRPGEPTKSLIRWRV